MAANHNLSLRTDRWKFIPPHAGGPVITWGPVIETGNSPQPQLYDMRRDRQEQTNVGKDYGRVVKQLSEWLEKVKRGE